MCRIEGHGVHGSGFLIEYGGMTGILTANSIIPDKVCVYKSMPVHFPRLCLVEYLHTYIYMYIYINVYIRIHI